ncbi:MAG: hypothetical protein IJU32_02595, partial [Pyramidobacter sp.]|nr:hypothetical protein [Pyramidobacter sp.]
KNRNGLADELPMESAAIKDGIERPAEKPDLAPQPLPAESPENVEPVDKTPVEPVEMSLICAECGQKITGIGKWSTVQIAERSKKLFGECLCVACAKERSARKSA